MRGHKLTLEALWRILWPKFLSWVTDNGKSLGVDEEHVKQVILDFSNRDIDSVTASFEKLVDESSHILELLDEYDSTQSTSSTFRFWRQYMGMVSIMMGFIRTDRDGDWKLHLYFFAKMLPWFALYDHVNYARWGPIYLADMSQLETSAPQVYSEFMKGKFSIKRTNKKFCQIASDQALEHINRVAKVSGGIVGITRLDSARDTWCITYNERAKASDDTLGMFGLQLEDENVDWHHMDTGPARLQRDEEDIAKIMSEFLRFGLFSQSGDALICLPTNDIAPEDVANELLSAEVKGQALVEGFVNDRLIDKTIDFYSTLKQNKTKTLASIYKVKVATDGGKIKTVQADRDLFRRLLVAAESGRNVKFEDILQHELSPTPLSLSDSSGKLLSTEKKDLGDILTSGLAVDNKLPDSTLRTCMVIDAPALIQAIGKPNDITTFGQLGDIFVKNVMSHFKSCTRIDVLFDRYTDLSIKSGTRCKRTGTFRPIRRLIDSVNVKLPLNWKQFISLPENKADLARFLTEQLMDSADKVPSGCELITAGGFDDLLGAWSSTDGDVEQLRGNHEEADTRLILHAADACKVGYGRTIISCRDTDVLVIALHFIDILSKEVWMRAGTSKNRKFIPIHQITLPEPVIRSIIGFHALTGCDSTSQFAGKGKKTAWKVFVEKDNASLLKDLGEDSASLGEDKVKAIEKFICHMYSYEKCESVNQVRLKIFVKGKSSLNGLPPTQDALHKHIARAHYQSLVWRQSLVASQKLPSPTITGWKEVNGELVPDLLSLDPMPSVCEQLVTCSCKTGCTLRCGCAGKKLLCTSGCECAGSCQNPYNSY